MKPKAIRDEERRQEEEYSCPDIDKEDMIHEEYKDWRRVKCFFVGVKNSNDLNACRASIVRANAIVIDSQLDEATGDAIIVCETDDPDKLDDDLLEDDLLRGVGNNGSGSPYEGMVRRV